MRGHTGFRPAIGAALFAALAGCSSSSSDFSFGPSAELAPNAGFLQQQATQLPQAQGESFGRGPVRVALLLPLTGEPALVSVGTSMANAAKLAMGYIEQNPSLGDNISVVLKDTGGTAAGAAQAASQAISEGASIILGPLRAEQVTAAGSVARAAGIPLIGFSNNAGAAASGVFLLNVLPEQEARRSFGYVKSQLRRQAVAAVFPATDFGRVQQAAFQSAVGELGLQNRASFTFSSEAEARNVVDQLAPMILGGQIDVLFLPDRSTAPSFAVLLESAGVAKDAVQIIGSADWNGDSAITHSAFLAGAIYPAIDDAGYRALASEYAARFGGTPHQFSTLSYTAIILANAPALALGTPRYMLSQLTVPAGFAGRDGTFRFMPDGRSQYALVVKRVVGGGATVVDGAKL